MDEFLLRIGIPAAVVTALHLDTLGRLVLACVLGGAVGVEREASGKPAGLRTNILICVGAALITEISVVITTLAEGGVRGDPDASPRRSSPESASSAPGRFCSRAGGSSA